MVYPAQRIEFAYPTPPTPGGTINVVCGPNNAGKSYFLQRIRKILAMPWSEEGPAANQDLHIACTSPQQPHVLSFDESTRHKAKAGIVFLGLKQTRLSTPANFPAYRRIALIFLLQQINAHLPEQERIEITERLDYADLRTRSVEHFEPEKVLYLCQRDHPVVFQIEELLQGTLYFRRSKRDEAGHHFEFVLLYGDGTTVSYSEWSEGQKACFYIITHVAFGKPDVILLDEIENHLHPAYITRMLEFLRREGQQSIITTHHPHVIFSECVDRVIYLETPRPPRIENPALVISHAKMQFQAWPKRKAVTLEDAFDLVAHAYKLFDLHDSQLLRQASRIASEADIEFYRILHEIYRDEVKPPTARVLPDRQSMQLRDRIRCFVAEVPDAGDVRILDLGAGLGRVAAETSKLSRWQSGAQIKWTCWEPDRVRRSELRQTLTGRSISADIPDEQSEIPNASAHLAVIANVLHELNPKQFAEIIALADQKIASGVGSIVVLELFPLLHPEKYAVPYPAAILEGILNDSGFTTDSEILPVAGGIVTAYCVLCRRLNPAVSADRGVVQKNVMSAWDRLEKAALSAYANRRTFRNFTEYKALLQDMTIIASVGAWKRGFWF